jgi:DNA topoisomerase-1
VARLRALVIPPAWRDVWISPYPNGHLQVVGSDDRGRRQYLYHPQWQEMRGRQKHERITEFARRLPAARRQVAEHPALAGMPRERALAAAFRLLDLGLFRVGRNRRRDHRAGRPAAAARLRSGTGIALPAIHDSL